MRRRGVHAIPPVKNRKFAIGPGLAESTGTATSPDSNYYRQNLNDVVAATTACLTSILIN